MLKIDDLLSEDFSKYPEEIRGYLQSFSDNLREAIKEELVKHAADEMLMDLENDKENFITKLSSILNNGVKGYNNMSTRALLDLYLEVKKQEDFVALLERVSNDME